ncbi:oxygen-binding di-iron domain-containing protein [Aminipila terrae]|uniref:MBL fold metallo-hydrolase n=1 Tax=Aminipila terrae TaxID=2697030 RepID=UPI00192F6AC7|nr:MBL fold metallo-hydrolase [Aminipila terrae]
MHYQLSQNCTVLGKVIQKPDIQISFLSYLLRGSKNILIDTVPERAAEKYLEELSQCMDLTCLDAIILNHSEEDHSGALRLLLPHIPDIPVYCTLACKERLKDMYPTANILAMEHNAELQLGEYQFRFIHTPGLHWDDNMVTYCENDQTLFSNDLFGQYLGSEPPLDNYISSEQLIYNMKRYYEKVFSHASKEEKKVLADIINLKLKVIALDMVLFCPNK